MPKQTIIGLTGERVSGKGTIAKHIIKKYKAKYYRFSSILGDLLERLYLPKSRANYIDLVLALRKTFGADILAKVMVKDISKDKNKLIIIDGIRYPDELEVLKKIPGFHLVYITADVKRRYERAIKRKEKVGEDKLTLTQFKKIENAPTEKNIPKIGKTAEYVIDTNCEMDESLKRADKIMEKII